MISPSRCRGAKDNGTGWLSVLRAHRQVSEELTPLVEDAKLLREENPGLKEISVRIYCLLSGWWEYRLHE
jgi:hypothetical protein